MFRVFDMQKNAWRIVNGETIEYINTDGRTFKF